MSTFLKFGISGDKPLAQPHNYKNLKSQIPFILISNQMH